MKPIRFKGVVHAMRSDLLKGQVVIAFAIPLNDETMNLREQFAMLKVMGDEVTVDVSLAKGQMQMPLPERADDVQITLSTDLASGEHRAVTISGDQLHALANGEINYPMRDE